MLSRVADDLYWLSRYVERGVGVSRLVDVTRHLELDAGTEDFWAPLVGAIGLAGDDVRFYLTSDTMNPDSLVSCARLARGLARGVRESLSSEMWEELNTLFAALAAPTMSRQVPGEAVSLPPPLRARAPASPGLARAPLARAKGRHFPALREIHWRAD